MIRSMLTLIHFAHQLFLRLSAVFTAVKSTTVTGSSGESKRTTKADVTAFGAARLRTATAGVLGSISFPSILIIVMRTATSCGWMTMKAVTVAIVQHPSEGNVEVQAHRPRIWREGCRGVRNQFA